MSLRRAKPASDQLAATGCNWLQLAATGLQLACDQLADGFD
jgi:hypothetical protein